MPNNLPEQPESNRTTAWAVLRTHTHHLLTNCFEEQDSGQLGTQSSHSHQTAAL
jgi:hypothetical protein